VGKAPFQVQAALGQRVGEADRSLSVAAADGGVGVDHPEVRIHAEPGDQEGAAVAVVGVEIASVVEVPVAAGDPRQRQRCLMDRIFIQGDGHGVSFQSHT
jgi:hypothetical protein